MRSLVTNCKANHKTGASKKFSLAHPGRGVDEAAGPGDGEQGGAAAGQPEHAAEAGQLGGAGAAELRGAEPGPHAVGPPPLPVRHAQHVLPPQCAILVCFEYSDLRLVEDDAVHDCPLPPDVVQVLAGRAEHGHAVVAVAVRHEHLSAARHRHRGRLAEMSGVVPGHKPLTQH